MGRGQGITQEQVRDHFSDVFGDRRGAGRDGDGEEASSPQLEGVTAAMVASHLKICGWSIHRGKDFEGKRRFWYTKDGHARVSRDGEVIGQQFTINEALQSQMSEEDVLAHGWVFREGKWCHPNPPDGREHAYESLFDASVCQYSFERREANN